MLSMVVLYLLFFHFYKNIQTIELNYYNLSILTISFLGIITLHNLIELITHRHPYLYRLFIIFFLLLYELLYLFQYRMFHIFDYAVLANNWHELFTDQSAQLVVSTTLDRLKIKDYINIMLWASIIIYWGFYKNKLKPRELKFTPRNKQILILTYTLLLITIITLPFKLFDQFFYLTQSIYRYHFPAPPPYNFSSWQKHYPYVHKQHSSFSPRRPNIILIAMESFNANFINAKAPNGIEYTPLFNRKIKEGIFLTNFFGNSVQTAKGHFSILCGLPPLIKGKALKQKSLRLKCLPKILQQYGYQTYFIQGYEHRNFDNTYNFMRQNGFTYFETTDTHHLGPQQKRDFIWGFGIQDDFTYQQAFQSIDRLHKAGKPIFAMIATISNHMDFHYLPSAQRKIFTHPHGGYQYYANSIRAADEYLKTFFRELEKRDFLKDSIIIITGDHSFPAGEHGYFLNEAGSYKELFRTPLLILNSKLTPQTINRYHSQLDIAPTILDMLGISTTTHFVGHSIFSSTKTVSIPLIQPYDGVHIGGIIAPYKYMFERRTRRHTLYNLKLDPDEKINIYYKHQELWPKLEKLMYDIYLNEFLIKNNLIWPPHKE